MAYKKVIVYGLPIFLLIFSLFYIWNNILILDDYHHLYEAFSENVEDFENTPIESNISTTISEKGYYVYINLDTLSLYLYKDGELVKTYPVSGGKSETPSPEGTWKITSKADWGKGFGGSWMGLNVPWGTLILDTF